MQAILCNSSYRTHVKHCRVAPSQEILKVCRLLLHLHPPPLPLPETATDTGKEGEITRACKDHQLHDWSLKRQKKQTWNTKVGKILKARQPEQQCNCCWTNSKHLFLHPEDVAAGSHSSTVIEVLQALGIPVFPTGTFYIYSTMWWRVEKSKVFCLKVFIFFNPFFYPLSIAIVPLLWT